MTLSLRARLVIGIVALLACGLVVADVAGVALLRAYLLDRLDHQLAGPVGRAPAPQSDPCANPRPDDGRQLPSDFVFTFVDVGGAVRCRLPQGLAATDGPDLTSLTAAALAASATDQRVLTVPGRDRAATWRVRVATTGSGGYAIVAVSTAEVEATLQRLALLTAGTGVVILALGTTGVFLLVRIGLRPLTAIEDTADAIARGDLSRRVPEAPTGTEVGRLAAALNTMLSQIEQAFRARSDSEDRLRRFVADASHELRTPIATIRGHAELYRQGIATDPDEVAAVLGRIESQALRMGALVEDLLLLARMDAAPDLDRADVNLLSVAADAVVDARAQDHGRMITLRPRTEPPWTDEPPVVRADGVRLRQVLDNLVSNAIRHTPATSPIEVEVGVRGASSVVRVVDHGPSLPPETAARVFERFYRGDPGRSRDAGGVGLGLAIVATLVQAHGGRVWYEPTPGGGSTFVVELPSS